MGALEQPTPTRQAEIDASNRLAQAVAHGEDTSIPSWQYNMAAQRDIDASNNEARRVADSRVDPTTGRSANDLGDRFTKSLKGLFTGGSAPAEDVQYDQMGNVISGGASGASGAPSAPRRPENGPGRVAPGSGPPLPKAGAAPALPNPAPAAKPELIPVQDPVGRFTPIKTTNPETPYDADIRFAHDVARMLAMGGDAEGHAQYLQQWDQLSAKRVQHIADEAIRAVGTGNIQKAIEIHNHVVPNGRQIVGYKPIEGGFEFQYDDGKTEKGSNAQIAQMLTQYKDPSYLIQVGLKTAVAKNDMAKEERKQALIQSREINVENLKAANKVLYDKIKADRESGVVNRIYQSSQPGNNDVFGTTKNGDAVRLVKEPGVPVNGKPGPETYKWVPISAQQAQAAGIPSGTGAAPAGVAGGGGVQFHWGAGG